MSQNHLSFKSYFVFILATIFLGIVTSLCLVFFIAKSNHNSNLELSKKEASTIESTISEAFGYSRKINNYIGKQIAQHGSEDLEFILEIFRQIDKSQTKNSQLISWSSFDFVAPNNLQVVNSKIGIRKDLPNMSARQYISRSKAKPWTLQVSFPVLGNPSNSWVIPAGTGIEDDNRKFLGIIVVGFDIAELTALVEQRLSKDTSFVVLDENFNIILTSKDAEKNGKIYQQKISRGNFNKKSATISNGLDIGKIRFFSYQKFDDYPYLILTGFSKTLLTKEFSNSVLPVIGGSIMITIFFLMILHLFKARILFLINEEKILQKSLLSKEDLINSKTNLIRATSHDLKNYIFGISGLSKLILINKSKAEIDTNEDLKMVEELNLQSEELMGFVEDLLDTNQNEDGAFNLGQKQLCNIVDLAKRMLILNKNFAMQNRISLEFDNRTNHKVINVECDVRRIKQVLNNVISNAVKYSNPNNVVILQISYPQENDPQKNEVCIAVIDQGIGMNEAEIKQALLGAGEKISKKGLNKNFDSHGLGMPIVKRLIELHHGTLEINSVKNYGTEVKIYLKICNEDKAIQNKEIYNSDNISNRFKGKAALVAEDNVITNKVITFFLRKMGFAVKHVENGEEILEQLDKQHFDLVVLDINMPKLGGFETAKTIRAGKIFKRFKNFDIPIIAISTEKQELSKLQNNGINMLLGKPFSEKELLDFVLSYIKN